MFADCCSLLSNTQRRLLVAAVVATACLVASPEAANASCGDYVIISGTEQGSDGDPAANVDLHRRADHGIPVCRGGGCGSRRETPASAPRRISLDEQNCGWLSMSDTSATTAPVSGIFTPLDVSPSCDFLMAAGVFRPPRFFADV